MGFHRIFISINWNLFYHNVYKLVYKFMFCLKITPSLGFHFPKLDLSSLYLVVSSDTSHNLTSDHLFQLVYITLLLDRNHPRNILQFSLQKSCKVKRSSLTGKPIDISDVYDYSHMLKHDIRRKLKKLIFVSMLADSELLFDFIIKDDAPLDFF